jgi:hypothetical protein
MEAGYLGVGAMGQPMAHKLLDAGHTLTIYDINETAMRPLLERQARRAASPRDLADRCEIVFVSLPTLAAFREVAFGAEGLASGKAMKLLVNTCTVGVPFVGEIARAMAVRGVTVADCPISGGPPGARLRGKIMSNRSPAADPTRSRTSNGRRPPRRRLRMAWRGRAALASPVPPRAGYDQCRCVAATARAKRGARASREPSFRRRIVAPARQGRGRAQPGVGMPGTRTIKRTRAAATLPSVIGAPVRISTPRRRLCFAVPRGGAYCFAAGGNSSRAGSGLILAPIAFIVLTRGDRK